jgi:DNA-binding GntR family transcriptional regulator
MGTTTMRLEALERIRREILSGAWNIGKMKSEREIAEELGMSRTPVREALAMLVHFGLVENYPQVGVKVHVPTLSEVDQALQLRRGIETVVVEELARQREDDAVHAVAQAADNVRMLLAHADVRSADARMQIREADTVFHTEMARWAGFGSSVDIIRSLRDRIHVYRSYAPFSSEQEHMGTVEEHRMIVEAIRLGNPRKARRALVAHLTHTRDRIGEDAPVRVPRKESAYAIAR